MKRFLLTLTLAVCAAAPGWADYKEGYYDLLDGKQCEELKRVAKECVTEHLRLEYSDLPNYWKVTDVYPETYKNSNGDDCLRWWDMYSDEIYLIYPGQEGKTAFSICKMQREHSVPKSWWKSNDDVEYTPAYSDMWNLYPSDGPANQAKSNYPLGVTQSTSFDNGVSKVGTPVEGIGGNAGKVFEPADQYKGDFARAYFYMATVYDDLPWVTSGTTGKYNMYEQNSWPTLKEWAVEMLLDWSRRDPVSDKEIARNDAVETQQGNRNPYIDFPELAEFVWGKRTGQTFYLSEQGSLEPTLPDDSAVDCVTDGYDGWIGTIDGGFSIIYNPGVANLRVYDVSGRLVANEPQALAGETFLLPSGIFVVACDGGMTPVKIVVR